MTPDQIDGALRSDRLRHARLARPAPAWGPVFSRGAVAPSAIFEFDQENPAVEELHEKFFADQLGHIE